MGDFFQGGNFKFGFAAKTRKHKEMSEWGRYEEYEWMGVCLYGANSEMNAVSILQRGVGLRRSPKKK